MAWNEMGMQEDGIVWRGVVYCGRPDVLGCGGYMAQRYSRMAWSGVEWRGVA